MLPVTSGQLFAQRHEGLDPHSVDIAQRAAGIGGEAEAEDGADIGFAWIGDDAFLDGAGGFQRDGDEEALLKGLDIKVLSRLLLEKVLEARPERFLGGFLPGSRKTPCRSCGRGGRDHRRAC